MPSRNPAGRPKTEGPKHEKPFQLLLTPAERRELEQQAAAVGMTMSAYARWKLFAPLTTETRYLAYHDSGQAALDEAADIAEDLAAAEEEMRRLNPPPN